MLLKIIQVEQGSEWMGKPMPLVCDHVDGDHANQKLTNFRLVCGNCDMQLDTYKSKNKGRGRTYDKNQYHNRLKMQRELQSS